MYIVYVHVQCIYVPGGRSLASPTRALPMLGRLAWLGSLLAGPGYNTHSHIEIKTQQQTIRIQMNTDHPLLDATLTMYMYMYMYMYIYMVHTLKVHHVYTCSFGFLPSSLLNHLWEMGINGRYDVSEVV